MQNMKLEPKIVSITNLQSLLSMETAVSHSEPSRVQTEYYELDPVSVQSVDPLIGLMDTVDRLETLQKKFNFLMHEVRYSLKLNQPRSK